MFFYIYILFSKNKNELYIGYTKDLKSRLRQHFKGYVPSTRSNRPLELIHYEAFVDNNDARAREIFLKSGFGRNQLKKCLQNKLKSVNYLK